MFKKGFITTYFLYILLLVVSIIGIYSLIVQNKIKTVSNIKVSNEFLNQELIVINFIKCELLNDDLKDGNYTINNLNFTVSVYEDRVNVYVNSNLNETILINLIKIEDNYIIDDYKTSTNLKVN